ncbi:hypothetical protein AB1046_16105 [Promicromonospora sp. Populi]|uniref:hypothetical protein n=1 Tax=Promicromonospora sp. Populi TaxID=3239420 RepID=UPI0034E26093
MVAGSFLILFQLVGLAPLVWFVAALLPGVPVAGPDPVLALAGCGLLAVAWTGWAWYRRRWNRAWELRKAWSWAIYDPRVLALPVRPLPAGEERDIDVDPEATQPYRARWFFPIEERPFVGAVYFSGSHTDRARGREVLRLHLPLYAFFLTLIGVIASPGWWDFEPGQYVLLLITFLLAALPPTVCSQVRYYRRASFATRLARAEVEERHQWMGWQLLHGVPGRDGSARRGPHAPSGSRPGAGPGPRANVRAARAEEQGSRVMLVAVAVFLFGVFGLVGVLAVLREPENGLILLGGVAFLGAVCLALLLWLRSGQQTAGQEWTGFLVRVDPPRDPRPQSTSVPVGEMVLTLSDGRAHLMPIDESVPELDLPVTALISGVGQLVRGGKQWLVLPDDTHVAITCSDYLGVRDAAAAAGITVLLPGPQPL